MEPIAQIVERVDYDKSAGLVGIGMQRMQRWMIVRLEKRY
jgi:hypothetical protein